MRERPQKPIREVALALLARRDHTSTELRDKLVRRGYPVTEVAGVVEALRAQGLLDDEAVVRRLVEREVAGGRGPLAIKARLAAKGVPPHVVERCLASLPPEWEVNQARQAVSRWMRTHRRTEGWRASLVRHLRQRGFGWEAIQCAVGADVDEEDWRLQSHEES